MNNITVYRVEPDNPGSKTYRWFFRGKLAFVTIVPREMAPYYEDILGPALRTRTVRANPTMPGSNLTWSDPTATGTWFEEQVTLLDRVKYELQEPQAIAERVAAILEDIKRLQKRLQNSLEDLHKQAQEIGE